MSLGTFLNGRSYVRLRGAALLFLSDVGHVVKSTVTDDSGGGGTTVWTAGTVGVPCRIDPLANSEGMQGGRISDRSTHELILPPGVPVAITDRFEIDGRGTYEVVGVGERTAGWTQMVEVAALDD